MSTAPATKIRYGSPNAFQTALRARVQRYFRLTGKRERDLPAMYVKSAVILLWFVASYVLLVFVADAWWQAVPLAISLGLATAAVGFNIQHDGNHKAYSRFGWVNRLAAGTLDFIGGSSYVWTQKHNVVHHTHTNVTGVDDDISVGFLGRLSPHQKRLWFHRFQHVYLWFLYMFLPTKWQFVDDYLSVATGRIGRSKFARPKGWSLAYFIAARVVFYGFALVLPAFFHPIWTVLLYYAITCGVLGLVLSTVFQLAHVVEESSFPVPNPETGRIDTPWAQHQLSTTVDFARKNRLLSWYAGGLNFQVEHHLFPRICHLHYPRVARIVERMCRKEGVAYHAMPTMTAGVKSHYRWLRTMGKVSSAA